MGRNSRATSVSEPAAVPNSGLTFVREYLAEVRKIAESLDTGEIERAIAILADTRQRGGRLFILGVGGSAANASHAVNDFRKITGMEAYAPTDNVAELTARTNDHGWATVFEAWLAGSRLRLNFQHRGLLRDGFENVICALAGLGFGIIALDLLEHFGGFFGLVKHLQIDRK